jgi:hypothetical protein
MAKRKHDWTWRRLEGTTGEKVKRPTNYRKPDYMINAQDQTVRQHFPHPIKPAIERFVELTERRVVGDDTCIVWLGGETFRVDDFTVTTPARFYWETMLGEKLRDDEALYRACKTPRCVKHKRKGLNKRFTNHNASYRTQRIRLFVLLFGLIAIYSGS